jgi:hypothetical protein
MSSSVSSERAFSQGGLTITKIRSCLKGDIVEALQCVKCAIRHDLLFREPAPSSTLEAEDVSDQELESAAAGGDPGEVLESAAAGGDPGDELDDGGLSWDDLLIEDEDEEAVSTMYDSD